MANKQHMSSGLHTHRRGSRRRPGEKIKKLKFLLITTGSICFLYFVMYMVLYSAGNTHNPHAWINSETNHILSYLVFILYVIYVAGAIRSYIKRDKYKTSFLPYQIFGIFLTLVFILLILLTFINNTSVERPEFIDEPYDP
jgi:hypothetical protein